MRLSLSILTLTCLALVAGAAAAQTEGLRHCNPEGVWYGYNTEGFDLIATIDWAGARTYSMVFDSGASVHEPPVLQATDFRGELKKLGHGVWTWRTFAYFALDTNHPLSGGFPLLLLDCPGTVLWDSCDAWHSDDLVCEWRGFFHGQDPFVEGIPIGGSVSSVYYKRMP